MPSLDIIYYIIPVHPCDLHGRDRHILKFAMPCYTSVYLCVRASKLRRFSPKSDSFFFFSRKSWHVVYLSHRAVIVPAPEQEASEKV